MTKITLYTDGACDLSATNRPGGWAAILVASDDNDQTIKETPISGGEENTTNNRMEMMAIIEGLRLLTRPTNVTVVSDSKYVVNSMQRNYKRQVNHDLWEELDDLCALHNVKWKYVRGHAGHEYNERCDKMAVAERSKFKLDTSTSPKIDTIPETSIVIYLVARASGKKGAYGAVIVKDGTANESSDILKANSDNEASLIAILDLIKKHDFVGSITVYTNNQYLISGITQWINGWMKKGWKNNSGDAVKFKHEWMSLQEYSQKNTIYWQHMNRKSGDTYFETADKLANTAFKLAKSGKA